MKNLPFKFGLVILTVIISSCATVQPYERQFVSDYEMQLTDDEGQGFNNYVHSIREGSTPSTAGKASGGCGCN